MCCRSHIAGRSGGLRKALTSLFLALFLPPAFAGADTPASMSVERPTVRLPAPAFSLPDLQDGRIHLQSLRGQAVLVSFWATWCAPCREELPSMQRLWERYRDRGLVILAVAVDGKNRRGVAAFVSRYGLSLPVLLDRDGEARRRYEVAGLPTTYLIGRDARISGRVLGARDWGSDEAFELVETLLGEP